MNRGPYIDSPEVLVHYNLTQVHTPRVSFRRLSNNVETYWCAVMRPFKTMVGRWHQWRIQLWVDRAAAHPPPPIDQNLGLVMAAQSDTGQIAKFSHIFHLNP